MDPSPCAALLSILIASVRICHIEARSGVVFPHIPYTDVVLDAFDVHDARFKMSVSTNDRDVPAYSYTA